MSITSFSFPTPIRFGAGARKLVAAHLLEQGLKRPLIVTDRALGALPVLAEFRTHLAVWTLPCLPACSATRPAAR
jgi:alcohol dehydrogenase class IV